VDTIKPICLYYKWLGSLAKSHTVEFRY